MAESPREILRRIRGIKSTQQITKAMEMVAAVKLTKVRFRAEHSRPYVDTMSMIMRALCTSAGQIEHPLFEEKEAQNILLVVLSSDRGLCGSFNANIVTAVNTFYAEHADRNISLFTIGRKGNDLLKRLGYSIESAQDTPWGDDIEKQVAFLNGYLIEAFETERVDKVCILYSTFENVLRYVPTVVQHLPIPHLTEEEQKELLKWSVDFIIEPGFQEVAEKLMPRYLETRLYYSIIESLASEYAARMVSMRNANDNAEEVIEDLTLTYNKARQASITKDLIDIIGGVEALNS